MVRCFLCTILLNATTMPWRRERKSNHKTYGRFLQWALDSVGFSFQPWFHDQHVLQGEALQTTVSLLVTRGDGSGVLGPKSIVDDEIRTVVTTTIRAVSTMSPMIPLLRRLKALCFPALKLCQYSAFW